MEQAVALEFRPLTSPGRLALRIGLVALASCFVCNVVYSTMIYLRLLDVSCIPGSCPNAVVEVFAKAGLFGGLSSVVLVPTAIIVMTPLILFFNVLLQPFCPEKLGYGIAVFSATAVFFVVALFLLTAASNPADRFRGAFLAQLPSFAAMFAITMCVAVLFVFLTLLLRKLLAS